MDFKIENARRSKIRLFQEFQYLDLIPYSLALLLLIASLYIIVTFENIVHSVK